jgi:hypothetical protein
VLIETHCHDCVSGARLGVKCPNRAWQLVWAGSMYVVCRFRIYKNLELWSKIHQQTALSRVLELCPTQAYREIRKPAGRPAATPPPMHSLGASEPSSLQTVGDRRWALKTELAAARVKHAATRMAARKRKAAATGQLNPGLLSRPARNSAAPTRYAAAPPSYRATVPAALTLRELVLAPEHIGARYGGRWGPSRPSVTDSAGDEDRAVYGVRFVDIVPMLKWLAPAAAAAFGDKIARRPGGGQRDLDADDACAARRTRADSQAWDVSQRSRKQNGGTTTTANGESRFRSTRREQHRGGSVICTGKKESSSGPHYDGSDSLLLAVSGRRTVWYAEPSSHDTRERDREATGSEDATTQFLPRELDPSLYPAEGMTGVRWHAPVILEAGDAVWIKAGWWHCVLSEANSVAVPLEVQTGVVSGSAPCVWRNVAPSRADRRLAGRRESVTQGWCTAASVRDMWERSQQQR